MNDITKEKESSFCLDILKYIDMAIEDPDTDGDRMVANILAVLSSNRRINIPRITRFYKEAREKLT